MKLLALSKMALAAAVIACGLYIAAFIVAFDIFSPPVRHQQQGWLGPVIRGDTQFVDIGKVYVLETEPTAPYRILRPLCVVWIWANGLPTDGS
jgi:hypothetical protein